MPPDSLLALVQNQLEDDKAGDIVVIPLSEKSSIADYMVIASGQSSRQVGAMTDHLVEMFRKSGLRGAKVEGRSQGDWVLVDAGDIVIHLFRPEVRDFYKLEKLWSHDLPETAEAPSAAYTA